MKIEVNLKRGSYLINMDESSFTVYPPGRNKEKKNYLKPRAQYLGHYTKFENAVMAIIRDELASTEETVDLKGFVERYKSVKAEVTGALPKL